MGLEYRSAAIDDIPTLISLERAVSENPTYSPMLDASEWEDALKIGTVYLIEVNGEAIGNASYESRGADGFYISGIMVIPKFQGKGIGRMVFQKLLDDMKDAKRIELVTHPDNVAALKLYESFGFVVESRHENYWGEGEPRLLLALDR